MFRNKKAQDLSISTIILIILGVVVLVVLILGFTQGWNTVKVWFTGGGTSEFQQISSQCSVACAANDQTSWCTERTITINDTASETATCEWFSAKYSAIDECSAMITCGKSVEPLPSCGSEKYPGEVCNLKAAKKCSGEQYSEVFEETKTGSVVCCKEPKTCIDI
jgi:hypothetical protein